MTKRKTGLALVIGAVVIGLIDRFTHSISSALGKAYCGSRYMQPVEGTVGDMSCGFNADMYLVAFLFAVLVVGIVLCVRTVLDE